MIIEITSGQSFENTLKCTANHTYCLFEYQIFGVKNITTKIYAVLTLVYIATADYGSRLSRAIFIQIQDDQFRFKFIIILTKTSSHMTC